LAIFGGGDIYLYSGCLSNTDSYSDFGDTYQPPDKSICPKPKEFLAGSRNFQVEEIEIYQV